jgi:hypothetical protein
MTRVPCLVTLVLLVVAGQPGAQAPASAPDGRVVVIAELFTSEGCSSCPPADSLLTQLVATQPIAGVRVVGLSQHVDYWDRLGWRDRFSSARFTARQTDYSDRLFDGNGIYTPQIVVDGHLQAVGNDLAEVTAAVRRAMLQPKAPVSVDVRIENRSLAVDVRASVTDAVAGSEPIELLVAVVENGLTSAVRSGENEGLTLAHSAVVRRLESMGNLPASQRDVAKRVSLSLDKGWQTSRLEVVALLQQRRGRRIVGAAAAPVVR